MKSTSLHTLNADPPMSPWKVLPYIVLNYCNNWCMPRRNLDPALREAYFPGPPSWLDTPLEETQKSPSRLLQDAFWQALPWDEITRQLGPIRMLDLGCGKGVYAPFFHTLLGDALERYIGFDVQPFPEWEAARQAHPTATFYSSAEGAVPELLGRERVNLIVSHSVLEHVTHDITLMQDIAAQAQAAATPLLQVHQVPSEANFMKLFGFHGVRQYSLRSLSQLSKLFTGNTTSVAVGMGGPHCNTVHFRDVSLPWNLRRHNKRREDPAAYTARLQRALQQDIVLASAGRLSSVSCYALCIASNMDAGFLQEALPMASCRVD